MRAASLLPQDGHANPRLAAPAFARAATRAGAQIVEQCEVASIVKGGEDFRVCCADGRDFQVPGVLVASGAWANQLCPQFGLHYAFGFCCHGFQLGPGVAT